MIDGFMILRENFDKTSLPYWAISKGLLPKDMTANDCLNFISEQCEKIKKEDDFKSKLELIEGMKYAIDILEINYRVWLEEK